MSEEDGMRVADLETQFAEMDGYTAEARAGDILNAAGIEEHYHFGLMKEVAPGKKSTCFIGTSFVCRPRHFASRRTYQQLGYLHHYVVSR